MNKLLIIFFLLFISLNIKKSLAKQKAIIKNELVKVYSDVQLKIPIGYLSRGQEIFIGDDLKLKGEVATTVISNKIAFLRSRDLILFRENSALAVTTESKLKDTQMIKYAKQIENSYKTKIEMSFTMARPTLAKNYKTDTDDYTSSSINSSSSGLLFSAHIEIWPYKYLGQRFGLDYIVLNYNNFDVGGIGLHYGGLLYLASFKYFKLGTAADLFWFPYSWIDSSYDETISISYLGMLYGVNLSLFLDFSFTKDWFIRVGSGYTEIKSTTYDATIEAVNSDIELEIPPLNNRGVIIYAGLNYKF